MTPEAHRTTRTALRCATGIAVLVLLLWALPRTPVHVETLVTVSVGGGDD